MTLNNHFVRTLRTKSTDEDRYKVPSFSSNQDTNESFADFRSAEWYEISTEGSISELVSNSKMMIYAGISNVPFDGLLSGCRVLHYIERHKFPMDRLFPLYTDYVENFTSVHGLESLLTVNWRGLTLPQRHRLRDSLFCVQNSETEAVFVQ